MNRLADPRTRAIAASTLATVVANLPVFLLGALAVQVQADLGFGDGTLGLVVGGFYAAGALVSPRAGVVVTRFGARRSLQGAAVASAATMAAASGLVRSATTLLLLLVVGGVANSVAQPAANTYLARAVPGHRMGIALGVQKSAIPAAALVGGLAVPLGQVITWRGVFVVAALAGVVIARLLPDDGDRGVRRQRDTPSGRPDVPIRLLVITSLGVGLGSSAANALPTFTVRGGVEVGLDERSAALLLIVGSVAGIAVRMLMGVRADRKPGKALVTMAGMFAIAGLCYALLAIQQRWLFMATVPLAFITAFAWPGLFHLAIVRSNPSAPAGATGIAVTGGMAGAVVGPVVFGTMAERWSYSAAWLTGALLLIGASLTVLSVQARIVERSPMSATV